MTAVIAITSGKTDVGRSLLSSNLAHYLNQKGYKTGILVAGCDQPLWGVNPVSTWPNIIGGRLSIDHAIERDVFGTDLMITCGNGHALGNLSTQTAKRLADPLGILNSYAYLIVDMAAGISSPAIACCLSATEAIMVLTPETQVLTAGFEWLAKLCRHGYSRPVNIVFNQIQKPAMAQTAYKRFRELAHKRLNIKSNLWGSISKEKHLNPSDSRRQPVMDLLPDSKLVQEIRIIGDRLLAEQPPENQTMPLDAFWQQFIQYLEKLPVIPFTSPQKDPTPRKTRRAEGDLRAARERQKPSPQPQPADAPQSFQQLGNQLTAIFDELKTIRMMLEERPAPHPSAGPATESEEAEEITIDFEEFTDRDDEKGP